MAKTSGASNLFPLIRYSDFVVGEEIGETGPAGRPSGPSGRFKRVCKGTFKYVEDDSQRDIVVLRYGRNGDVEKQREVEILAMLARDPDARKFVPQVFGACEERPERLVLQERAHLGSLKTALSEGSDLRHAFTPPHRLHAAFQVSRAMVFLESLRIVHCDLSCRNCLLFYLDEEDDAGVLVKITDMGLAFVLPEGVAEVTKKQPQAVRWCAPETVGRAILSHQADAWSVGMTIWELWSGGCNPWPFRERRPEVSAILRGLGAGGTADAANEYLEGIPLAANKELPRPFISMQDEMPVPDCEPHGISCPKPVNDVICGATIIDPKRRKGLRQLLKDLADIIRSLQQPPERPQENSPGQHSVSVPAGPPKPRRLVAHNAALSCKESVERITSNNDVCFFYEWALTRWDQIFDLFLRNTRDPSGQAIVDSAPRDQHGLTRQQWVDNITDMGFKGDAGVVFEEMMLENVGVDAVRQAKAMAMGASIVPTATLPQVKRFAARIAAASSSLTAGDGASPAAAFARHLKSIRGTVLKAWRQDIDLRKAGRVAYADFTNACRKLGLSSQGRLIWDCLRKEARTAPLEFHEVAPEEAENMEGFCEILLTTYGFDLEKAWRDLDPNNQQYLSLPDFVAAARALGFEGNPKLIFKGLDAGLGRLLPENFEYLAKISNKAPYGRSQSRGPMADLITFVRRESPDVTTFLNKLGITSVQGEIAVNDLAARLTAVGFEGDALQASLKAARTSGGSRVSVEMLRMLLSGDKIRDTDSEAPSAVLWGTARLPGPKQRPFRPMQAWNDSIDNFSEQNLSRCHSSRQYFGGTSTSPIVLDPRARQH
mmetsp:Transcript_89163/g.186318  ORF Transcript_89163/g.186318 Transcript_89163/m.186318 type:complete len:829 (+) Transcript_89163:136-2622(+)|eukprot:CAMPEP_0206455108 /NCGR_PEP_ID=MMETSP0324_2-20121206/21553_1 /ASSEMBLY_ACC=CAM_ASM_000836 /TAXON_ID=2866 /ORGANISM="Crypthecodinium cohnii, Strain Seligo" /LENGTH=828 /DNA_ID=CAMNT_0053925743 /DNA_START=130 /DNA_END=2616 /DNA_ORIENTATION=+